MNYFSNLSDSLSPSVVSMVANFGLLFLIFSLFLILCLWLVYAKADKPGWAAFIPVYNAVVMLQMIGKPLWWLLLFLIPGVNLIVAVIILIGLARSFGKGPLFGIGLLVLPFIFYPILAFGESQYLGVDGTDTIVDPDSVDVDNADADNTTVAY